MAQIGDYGPFDSFDDVDNLLALVMPEQADDANALLDLFVRFVDARLANKGWTPEVLARALNVKTAWVIALLNRRIPAQYISDDLLIRLAEALDYEPNALRILLNRNFTPLPADDVPESSDESRNSPTDEIGRMLDEMTVYLLEQIDRRDAHRLRFDERRAHQHEFVLKQIEFIIARHRSDIKMIESLIDELKSTIAGDEEPGPQRLDIRRIIHHIKDSA